MAGKEKETTKFGPGSGLLALYFGAALAASAVSFGLIFSLSESVSHAAGSLHDRHYELLTTASSLIMLDSRLTMLANRGAVTGAPGYAREHGLVAAELNKAIKNANRVTASTRGSPHTVEINEANLRLMELEDKALALAGSGKKREASALLAGSEYLALGTAYARAVDDLLLDMQAGLKAEGAAVRGDIFRRSLKITVSVFVMLALWALAAVYARRWLRARGSTEALVAEKEAQFRHFFDTVQEVFYRADWKGNLVDVTPSISKYSGYTREELLGRPVSELYANPEDRKGVIAELLLKGMIEDRELRLLTKDRRVLDVLLNARLLRGLGGLPAGIEGSLRDITARKAAEDGLRRVNRLYKILSLVNEAATHVRTPQKLYEEVCRIAVENGGVKFAWVGLTTPDGQITPVAAFGDGGGYLKEIRVSTDHAEPEGRGPSGTAARERKVVVNSDTENNIFMLPWRRAALKRGFRSSATFPVAGAGVVAFYAAEPRFFTKDEERLLESLAESITFAVNSMHACPEERARAEAPAGALSGTR